MFITPGGNGVIGANVMSQYEQTIRRDMENDLPAALVKHVNTQKSFFDFTNGYRLMFRPFDDADKLRSLNLDFYLIMEASEVKADAYTQLGTRLRNTAAGTQRIENGEPLYDYTDDGVPVPVMKADWRQGIIESNSDSGWIKQDHLLCSDKITVCGTVTDKLAVDPERKDPNVSSFITASDKNKFLPVGFIDGLKRNKPAWWVARYVDGSFSYSEGLIYPSALKHVVPYFRPPSHWKRCVAHDYGLVDPSVFLFGAVHPTEGKLYIYEEVRTSENNVAELARLYKEAAKDIPAGGYAFQPLIDPRSGPKRDYDKLSLMGHYLEYGIAFKPGAVSVDARILKLNTYIESGYLKIMDNCRALIKEFGEYKWLTSRNNALELMERPEDKNNHSINCLEWIAMELPAEPKNILSGVYAPSGEDVTLTNERAYAHWALKDDEQKTQSTFFSIDYTFGGF